MMAKRIKSVIASVLLLFCSASLFAVEEYISQIYKELDLVFAGRSSEKLNTILSANSSDKYYYLIENYTEKKIRRLIVNNDYEFAMDAIVIVIENNLDNEQAVEMYSVISEAYEAQQVYEAQQELKRQQELARIEAEKEKKRASVDKEYISASKNQGGSVYVSGKETKLTSYRWKAALGLVDLLYLFEPTDGINTFHYGPSIDFLYEYTMPKLVIGADVFAGVQFLAFTEDNDILVPLIGDLEAAVKLAFPFAKNLFLRAGLDGLIAGKSDTAARTSNVCNTLYSPLIGIKIERIKLGSAELDLGADWYAGSLYTENLNLAAGGLINLALPFAEMEKVKLNFNIGIRDKLFVKESAVENRASLILAIGVENVIK